MNHDGIAFAHLDRGTGVPCVFQHGLGGSTAQAAELWPRDVGRLLSLDCRGHGATLPLGDPLRLGFGTMAADVGRLLDELAIDGAFVGGLSMGAGVAGRLAAEDPGRVLGLILVRPAWLDAPRPGNLRAFPRIAELLETRSGDDAHRALAAEPSYREVLAASPASAAALRDQLDRPHARERASVLRRMVADTPLAAGRRWRDVELPTLVIATKGDPIHPWSIATGLARQLPAAELHEVPAKDDDLEGHLHAVADHISRFVARHGGGALESAPRAQAPPDDPRTRQEG